MQQNLIHSFRYLVFLLGFLVVLPAQAQFMWYPFYGSSGINSHFDHRYPNYSTDGKLLTYDGVEQDDRCYSPYWTGCYDGHSGLDYSEVYEPILAAAAGDVVHSGWYSSNHESSYGLSIKLDHGNDFRTLYGHLSSILRGTGSWVEPTLQVGTGGTTGNSSGAHLHFEAQRKVSGTWRAVDPLGWTPGWADPWETSTGAESIPLYLSSPTTSSPPNLGTTTVDNSDSGFSKWCSGSTCPYWYSASAGLGGSMWYTYSNGSVADYKARWTPTLGSSDNYEVQVHIPNDHATTHAARYKIVHGFGTHYVHLDQHDTDGSGAGRWVSLGTYHFSNGSSGYVEISDATYIPGNYTEPSSTNRKVGVDAARFIRRGITRHLRQMVFDNNVCTQYTTPLAATGESVWSGTTTSSCSTSLPGSGNVQTYFAYATGGKLHEAAWRGGTGYTRSTAIVGTTVQWGQAPNWSQVGTGGTFQAQGGYVMGRYLRQFVWDGGSCTQYRATLDTRGLPDWSTQTTLSCPTTLPGSGTVQTYSAFISGGVLQEACWRGGTGYTRNVPISNGAVQWGQAPGWSVVGSGGTYQAQSGFVLP